MLRIEHSHTNDNNNYKINGTYQHERSDRQDKSHVSCKSKVGKVENCVSSNTGEHSTIVLPYVHCLHLSIVYYRKFTSNHLSYIALKSHERNAILTSKCGQVYFKPS
jgi:hypothetical protein